MLQAWKGKGRTYSAAFLATLPDIGTPSTSRQGALTTRAYADLANRPQSGGLTACSRQASSVGWTGVAPPQQRYTSSLTALRWLRGRRRYSAAGAALAQADEDEFVGGEHETEIWMRHSTGPRLKAKAVGIGVQEARSSRDGKRLQGVRPMERQGVGHEEKQRRFPTGSGWPRHDGEDEIGTITESHNPVKIGDSARSPSAASSYSLPQDDSPTAQDERLWRIEPSLAKDPDQIVVDLLQLEAAYPEDMETAGMSSISILSPDKCTDLIPVLSQGNSHHQSWRSALFESILLGKRARQRSKSLALALRIFQDLTEADRRTLSRDALGAVVRTILITPPEEMLRMREYLDCFFDYCMATLELPATLVSRPQNGWLRGRYLAKTIAAALRCRMLAAAIKLLMKGEQRGLSHLGDLPAKGEGQTEAVDRELFEILKKEADPAIVEAVTGALLPEVASACQPDQRIVELRMRALLRLGRPRAVLRLHDRYCRDSGRAMFSASGLRFCACMALGKSEQLVTGWSNLASFDVKRSRSGDATHLFYTALSQVVAKGGIGIRVWKVAFSLRVWSINGGARNRAVMNAMIASGLALGLHREVEDLLPARLRRAYATSNSSGDEADFLLRGTAATYAVLLNACRGELSEVTRIWRDYKVHSITHDSRVLAALVRALIRIGETQAAEALLQNRITGVPDEWNTMDMRLTAEALNPITTVLTRQNGLDGALHGLSWFLAAGVVPDKLTVSSIVTTVGHAWGMRAHQQQILRTYFGRIMKLRPSLSISSTASLPQMSAPLDFPVPGEDPHLRTPSVDPDEIPTPTLLFQEVTRRKGALDAEHVRGIIQAYMERGALDLAIAAAVEASRRGVPDLPPVIRALVQKLAYSFEQERSFTLLRGLHALGCPFPLDDVVSITSIMEKQGYYHMAAGFLRVSYPLTRTSGRGDDVFESVQYRILMRDGQENRAIRHLERRDRPLTEAMRHDIARFLQWYKNRDGDEDVLIANQLHALLEKPYTREAEKVAEIKDKIGKALKACLRVKNGH